MDQRNPQTDGLCRWAVKLWFSPFFRKIRVLHSSRPGPEGPTVLAVGRPASFFDALILSTAFDEPVHCLMPRNLVRGPLAAYLARGLGMVLCDDERTASAPERAAVNIVARGGTLVVFADQTPGPQDRPGALARSAAALVARVEPQLLGRRVAVRPVHLFLPLASSQTRELLIHVDAPIERAPGRPAAGGENEAAAALASIIEHSFRANAFQLRPADLEYFSTDLEAVLQSSLQEDWAARPNWKQDVEGFVLSGFVAEWVRQTNYLDPGRIVALRESLDEYRAVLQQRALRQFEVETSGALLHSGSRRALVWLETLLGAPIALYGAVNHLVIGALLGLAGVFKNHDAERRATMWTIGGAIVLAGYAIQIYFVSHRWGRAVAGYYAPTLPVAGAYLWRYLWLLRHRTRLLLLSITIARLTSKAKELRAVLLEELDQAVVGYEARVGAPQ